MLPFMPDAVWDPAWLAAIGALISALGGAIGAILGNVHRDRKNDDKLKRITKQVENNHGDSNLRDDVDKVISSQDKVENQITLVEDKISLVHESVKALAHSVGEARAADAIVHDDHAARLRSLEQNTR